MDYLDKVDCTTTEIRHNGKEISRFPKGFCEKVSSLEILSLPGNNLSSLPKNFAKLKQLRQLELLKNNLNELPQDFGNLQSLTWLCLANNKIEALPFSFGNLQALEFLNLECNHLSALPDSFRNLVKCKSINLNQNRLIRLPKEIGYLPNLTSLSASLNAISYIPESLGQCISLKRLKLSSNQISFIPDQFCLLVDLEELSLDNNDLCALPSNFFALSKLRLLQIDNNPQLEDPSEIIIGQGAQILIQYMHERYNENELQRMRDIIRATIELLKQAQQRGIIDTSLFRAEVCDERGDAWFAFQKPYLWEVLVPRLEELWEDDRLSLAKQTQSANSPSHMTSLLAKLNLRKTPKHNPNLIKTNDNWMTSFPYSEKDVDYAFNNFTDAYGLLIKREKVMLTKCSCIASNGQRLPCIPPQYGFMCYRMSLLYKGRIVSTREKSERTWIQYKKQSILDATKKAKEDAVAYLESFAGREFLTSTSFAKAEEFIQDKGVDKAIRLRSYFIDKRKKNVLVKFEKSKQKLQRQCDKRSKLLQSELSKLRQDESKMPEGYLKTTMNNRINDIMHQLANMEEMKEMRKLDAECDQQMKSIDEEAFMNEDSSDDDDDDSMLILPDPNDNSFDAERVRFKIKRKEIQNKKMRDLLSANISFEDGEITVEKKKSLNDATDKRDVVIRDDWNVDGDFRINKELTIVEVAVMIMKQISIFVHDFERLVEPHRERILRKLTRNFMHIIDVADMRMRRMYLKLNGKFDELQREFWHELYYQYINFNITQAKLKAEMDFKAIERVRRYWDGASVEAVFKEWKSWTKNKQERLLQDYLADYHSGAKNVETALTSVDIVQLRMNEWQECVDVYSDSKFWKNLKTGQISVDQPKLENFLPPVFSIPEPPKEIPEEIKALLYSTPLRSKSHDSTNLKKYNLTQLALTGNVSPGVQIKPSESIHNLTIDTNYVDELESTDRVSCVTPANLKSPVAQVLSERVWLCEYGPDNLRITSPRFPRRFRNRLLVNEDLSRTAKLEAEKPTSLQVQADTARKFRANLMKEKMNGSLPTLSSSMMFIEDENKSNISEIKSQIATKMEKEYFKSHKAVQKRRHDVINPIRRETYQVQLYNDKQNEFKKNIHDEHDELLRHNRKKKLQTDLLNLKSLANPDEEKLLELAGASVDMTRISGEDGLKLRSIIATRALHVKNLLRNKAIEVGVIKPKEKTFYEREILPLFKSGYISSDSDDEKE